MMQKVRWTLLVVGVVVAIVIASQNNFSVDLKLLFFQPKVSLTLLILITIGIGFLLGAMITYGMLRPRKPTATKQKSKSKTTATAQPVEAPPSNATGKTQSK